MEHALILLAIGLLLNVFHKFDAELNVIPRDTEVMVNESTYMNCSTSLEAEKVQWHHDNYYVYTGRDILEPYDGRFSVEINSSTGTSNLVIRSVQPSDAGQYECLEDEGFAERRSAQLIVLDDYPVCKSNMRSSEVIGPNTCGIEPDKVKLSCSITYHGNTFPILQWKASRDNQSITGLLNFTSNKNNVTYTLTMKSTLDLNDSSFICQTTRTSKKHYSCSSDVIKILYVFSSNITINLTMDDEVSCFANSSQSCSYKWKWIKNDDSITVSNDQVLIPTRVGWHRCEATCSIGNKSCTVEPMYAEVIAAGGQHLLPLMILLVLPVIVLIVVVIYCRRKHHLYCIQKKKSVEQHEKEGISLILKRLNNTMSRSCQLENTCPILLPTMAEGANDPSRDTFRKAIEQHRKFLEERIDPDYGLLSKLLESRTLSRRECDEIEANSLFYDRNSKILDFILKKDEGDRLVTALRDADQIHIANYLIANAEYKSGFGGEWPLTEKEVSILDKNLESLADLLELSDLLGLLYSSEVVNKRQMDSISSKPTSHEKNQALIVILRRRSLRCYRQTITCLHHSKQSHIAEILEKGGAYLDGENVSETENEISTAITNILSDRSTEEANRIFELAQLKVMAAKTEKEIGRPAQKGRHSGYFEATEQQNESKISVTGNKMATEVSETTKDVAEKTVQYHRRFLEDHIDPDTRLLDILLANRTLSKHESKQIKHRKKFYERNSELLNCILAKHQSDRLVTALRETQQIHIVNYLNENGEYKPEIGGDWPLTEKEDSILNTNQGILVDLLECDELLGLLYSSKVINKRQMDSISSKPTSHEKNEALLECLQRRSLRDYWQTIKCLRQTKQSHIAEILEEGGAVVRVHANLDGENVTEIENEISTAIANMIINDRSSEEANRVLEIVNLKVIAAKTGQ